MCIRDRANTEEAKRAITFTVSEMDGVKAKPKAEPKAEEPKAEEPEVKAEEPKAEEPTKRAAKKQEEAEPKKDLASILENWDDV